MIPPNPPHFTRGLLFAQWALGLVCYLFLAIPYLRKVHGLGRLYPGQRYLFVSNHVSLLDTVILGALCWRRGCLPILALGDKSVWQATWFKRALSSPFGFLLERGKLRPSRIRELNAFARANREFNLLVFPEGTRGDGIHIGTCQPGIYYIAQEAATSLVPIFIENMQLVSTKHGRFHPVAGLRRIEVYFGAPIPATTYLSLPRNEFIDFLQHQMYSARPARSATCLSPVLRRV